MEPALRPNDLKWVLRAGASHAPRRVEVWIVEGPHCPTVKRVAGLPGEVVTWEGPDVQVNGMRLDEPWVLHPERSGSGTLTCGAGYLVLGDNRPQSQDGRAWGAVPVSAMTGRLL